MTAKKNLALTLPEAETLLGAIEDVAKGCTDAPLLRDLLRLEMRLEEICKALVRAKAAE